MSELLGEDIQKFHRWSRTYERSLGQVFLFDPVHRKVVSLVAACLDGVAPARVLDIGCGTGRLLRRAARRWPAARLFGRGEEIPLPDSSVDVAFSTVSFHHWENQAAGVREVARVLRPGGLFCLADSALPGLVARFISHTRIHTRGEVRLLFEQAGLRVVMQAGIRGGAVAATVGRNS